MFSYSFWADEAYVSSIAMKWVTNILPLLSSIHSPGVTYQMIYMMLLGGIFRLLGPSEVVARIPSGLAFIIGIFIIFQLAKKLSNSYGAILSTFLYSFSHLNLAYATQAKPYIFLEVSLLGITLLMTNLSTFKKKFSYSMHFAIIVILITSFFLHKIGLFLIYAYACFLFFNLRKNKIILLILSAFIAISLYFIFTHGSLNLFNNSYQVVKLFTYKYTLITLCACLGGVFIHQRHKDIFISLLVYTTLLLFAVMFLGYIFNIRYVLPLFGLIFLFFGIFWAKVGEKYDSNLKFKIPYFAKASKGRFNFELSGKAIIPLTVLVLLYATGYKIVRWPQAYYNPNIDKYGDVQIANYKDFYSTLKERFPNYKSLYVVNDTFDVEYWYFGRYSNAYFMKFTEKPYKHHTADAMVYGSLSDFKKIMEQ